MVTPSKAPVLRNRSVEFVSSNWKDSTPKAPPQGVKEPHKPKEQESRDSTSYIEISLTLNNVPGPQKGIEKGRSLIRSVGINL
jgi:hypothetical protein